MSVKFTSYARAAAALAALALPCAATEIMLNGGKLVPVETSVVETSVDNLNFCFATGYPDGSIHLNHSKGIHTVTERQCSDISKDNGRTWKHAEGGACGINSFLNSEGKKMGKSVSGAVWLDGEKTSPYEFYQYWRNVDDADVVKFIKMLTFISLDEIAKMEKWQGAELNRAKEILAYELTKMVHGEAEAEKAQSATKALFSGEGDDSQMPTTKLEESDINGNVISLLDLLVKTGLAVSKSEARRLVMQGGIYVNNVQITDISFNVCRADLTTAVILRKGKKTYQKVIL